jgi:predicted RNA-binding protein with PUA-like domain
MAASGLRIVRTRGGLVKVLARGSMQYWLVKTEPDCFSIQDLARAPKQTTRWDGVRNYQARNFMRDQMRVGDRVLFYHSGVDRPAVAGVAVVVREAYPDHTAWDPADSHYDPHASAENPIWQMVDLQLERVFTTPLPLDQLRGQQALAEMELLRRGSRLSVQPVRPAEFRAVLRLAEQAGPASSEPATRRGSRTSKRR